MTYKYMQFQDEDHKIIRADKEDGSFDIIEPNSPEWPLALAQNPSPYQPLSDEFLLSVERASMRCRAAAMRLVLIRAGKLEEVQTIADSDPEASIVWEYEPEYVRNSPFIQSLSAENFTPEEVDDLFREAMKL